MSHVLAVDIGGTKIATALVDEQGTVLAEEVSATPSDPDPEAVFAPAAAAIERLLSGAGEPPAAVGIGSAGPIHTPTGTVSPVNIAAWRDYPVIERVTGVLQRVTGSAPEVRLAGDGHCFALGEHWLGAGRDWTSMVGMVVSTGVGGGAVVDDRLVDGGTGNAVHLGHISVNAWGPRCVCGCHGCVEMYARGPAMVAAAKVAGWTGGDDAKALTADARAGNATALEAIDYGMRALAAGIAATASLLDVDRFVVGGGVSRAGEVVFDPLREHLRHFATLAFVRELEVRPAELENAGLLGAAALGFTLLR